MVRRSGSISGRPIEQSSMVHRTNRRSIGNVRNVRRGISRRRFVGTAAAGVGAAALGFGGVVMAKKPMPPKEEVWIYPTGNPEPDHDHPVLGHVAIGASGGPLPITADAYEIQMAILENPGKKIVLKAHNEYDEPVDFVLGRTPEEDGYLTPPPGTGNAPDNEPSICLLLKDVLDTELTGETVNGRATTLKGGKFLFYSPFSEASIKSYGYYYLDPDEHKIPEGEAKHKMSFSNMIVRDAWGDCLESFATEATDPGDEETEYDVHCDVSVTNVRFENITTPAFQWRAMYLANVGNTLISDCHFDINTYDVVGWTHALMLATKKVTVARNNHIKVGPAFFGSFGIALALTREGSMTYVSDNTIEFANIGIWMENDNRGVYDISNNNINAWNCGFGGGNAVGFTFGSMKHNDIHLMPEEEPNPLVYTVEGFPLLPDFPPEEPPLPDPLPWTRYGDLFAPFPTGIIGVSTGWSGVFGLQSYLSKALVEGNRFSGTMNRGVYLGFDAHDNIFKANNMRDVNFIEVSIWGDIMPPTTFWFEGASRENKALGNTGGVEWVEDLPDYDPPFSYFYYVGETGGEYIFNEGSEEYEPAPGGPGTGTHNFFQYEGCGDAGYSDDGKSLYFKRVWQPFPGDYVDNEPTYRWFYVPVSCDPFIKNNRFTGPGFRGLGSGLGHVNSNIHNELKFKYADQLTQGNMAALNASLKRIGMKVD